MNVAPTSKSGEVRPAAKRPPPHVQRHPARCHPCGEAHATSSLCCFLCWGQVINQYKSHTWHTCHLKWVYPECWHPTQIDWWGLFSLDMKLEFQPLNIPRCFSIGDDEHLTHPHSTTKSGAGEDSFFWEAYWCHEQLSPLLFLILTSWGYTSGFIWHPYRPLNV